MTPEQLHLALNHLPVIGAALALIPLVWGLISRKQDLLLCGILIAFLTGWFTPVVMGTGEEAYERYESEAMQPFLDPGVELYLELHEHRAHDWAKLMYGTAILATLALVARFKKKEWLRVLSIALVLSCIVTVITGVWIAESGGKIRRVDFRIEDVR